MRRLIWTASAGRDMSRLNKHIANSNPFAAARVLAKLAMAAESLRNQPERGRKHPRGWRELTTVKPYIVRYRADDACVRILGVRHAARRPL